MPEHELHDPESIYDHEVLPDENFILNIDIRRAFEGKPFRIFPPEGGKGIPVTAMSPADVNDYLTIFQRYKLFGLPYSGGWAKNLPWVIDMIQSLEVTYHQIKAWRTKKAYAAAGA